LQVKGTIVCNAGSLVWQPDLPDQDWPGVPNSTIDKWIAAGVVRRPGVDE